VEEILLLCLTRSFRLSLRLGEEKKKKEEERKKERRKKSQGKNIMACPIPQGGHKQERRKKPHGKNIIIMVALFHRATITSFVHTAQKQNQ